MKILITGVNGQIGTSLTNKLKQINWDCLQLTRSDLDISNAVSVSHTIRNFMPSIVINAAAFTAVDQAEFEEKLAYSVNAAGCKNLAESANDIGVPLIHISTDYVFNGTDPNLYVEDDQTDPLCIYGSSKLKGEQEIIEANSKHIILRTAWVFSEYRNNFVKKMIQLGATCKHLNVVSDQFGGPTYAGDIADALIKMLSIYEVSKNLPWGVYHFTGFPYVSWFEFAQSIFEEVAVQKIYEGTFPTLSPITSLQFGSAARRPSNSRLNCTKIKTNFNINMSDWKKALKNLEAYSGD